MRSHRRGVDDLLLDANKSDQTCGRSLALRAQRQATARLACGCMCRGVCSVRCAAKRLTREARQIKFHIRASNDGNEGPFNCKSPILRGVQRGRVDQRLRAAL